MRAMKSSPDLNQLLRLLLDSRIEFVVIGGFAGVLHGSTVVTRDLDICMVMESDQLEKLRNVLTPFHPVHRRGPAKLSFLEMPKIFENVKNLYLDTDLGTLDILGDVIGVGDFQKVAATAIQVNLFNMPVKIISIEELIRSKRELGRPKDLLVIAELEKIKK